MAWEFRLLVGIVVGLGLSHICRAADQPDLDRKPEYLLRRIGGDNFFIPGSPLPLGFANNNQWFLAGAPVRETGIRADKSPRQTIFVWEISTGKKLREVTLDSLAADPLTNVWISNDGQVVHSLSAKTKQEGIVHRWKIGDGTVLPDLKVPELVPLVKDPAVSPKLFPNAERDRSRLAFLEEAVGPLRIEINPPSSTPKSIQKVLRVFDVKTGKDVFNSTIDVADSEMRPVLSADCKLLAYATHDVRPGTLGLRGASFDRTVDTTIHVYDLDEQRELWSIAKPGAQLSRFAFTPDKKQLLASGRNGSIALVWNLSTGEVDRHLPIEGGLLHQFFEMTPDGERLIVDIYSGIAVIDFKTGRSLVQIPCEEHWVYRMLSSDKKLIVFAGNLTQIFIYDLSTGKPLRPTQGHIGQIVGLSISNDGRRLSSIDESGRFNVWDMNGGGLLVNGTGLTRADYARLSPDGRSVMVSPSNSTSQLFAVPDSPQQALDVDLSSRGKLGTLCTVTPAGDAAAYQRADGKLVVVKNFLEPADGKRELDLLEIPEPAISLGISADGRYVAALSASRRLRVWRSGEKSPIASWELDAPIRAQLTFSKDGKYLAAASTESLLLFSTEKGKLRTIPHSFTFRIGFGISADGKYLALTGGRGSIRLYDTETLTLLNSREQANSSDEPNRTAVFSSDGKLLFAEDDKAALRTWTVPGLELSPSGLSAIRSPRPAAVLSDGRYLGIFSGYWMEMTPIQTWSSAGCELFDLTDGKSVRTVREQKNFHWIAAANDLSRVHLVGSDGFVTTLDQGNNSVTGPRNLVDPMQFYAARANFSPSGSAIAGTSRTEIQIWNAADGKLSKSIPIKGAYSWGTVLAAGGQIITSGSDGLAVWNVADGKQLWSQRLSLQNNGLGPLQFARVAVLPDGESLAYTIKHDEVNLLELTTGRMLRTVKANAGPDGFSPDSRLLATTATKFAGMEQDCISIIEILSGKTLLEFPISYPASRVAISPNGKRLVVGYQNGYIDIYDLAGLLDGFLKDETGVERKTPTELFELLASENPVVAWRAAYRLSKQDEASVELLRTINKGARTTADDDVRKLIVQLASEDPEATCAASSKLRKLADQAIPAIRAELAKNPPAFVKTRLEILLAVNPGAAAPNMLRDNRAVLVAEWIGSPAVRAWLADAIKNSTSSEFTRGASAVLRRWESGRPGK